ncbi:hypothetical protein [Campylobacter hyointestinalis]|uniref:hypothetical protein n=1 Tax=Campylobacter hyointestinalis TaxID=198 RepID=UPI00072721F2|nr:hypothetical protein [Campylobacter hyointestinalis]CUU92028.1 Uncharacterised protein [Campylobacter hyointestinalis subsp. hyointestinalis]
MLEVITSDNQNGIAGNLISNNTQVIEQRNVVITTKDSEATLKIYANLEVIKSVASKLHEISITASSVDTINQALTLKDDLENILANKDSIINVARRVGEIDTIVNSVDSINTVSMNVDTIEKVSKLDSQLRMLYTLRSSIARLNAIEDKLVSLDAHRSVYEDVFSIANEIKLCYEHMLAIEIVAQNIGLLEYFNIHIESFISLMEIKSEIILFAENVELAKELVKIAKELPTTLNETIADIERLKDVAKNSEYLIEKANKANEYMKYIDDFNSRVEGTIADIANFKNELVYTTNVCIKTIQDEVEAKKDELDTKVTTSFNEIDAKTDELKKYLATESAKVIDDELLKIADLEEIKKVVKNIKDTQDKTKEVLDDSMLTSSLFLWKCALLDAYIHEASLYKLKMIDMDTKSLEMAKAIESMFKGGLDEDLDVF